MTWPSNSRRRSSRSQQMILPAGSVGIQGSVLGAQVLAWPASSTSSPAVPARPPSLPISDASGQPVPGCSILPAITLDYGGYTSVDTAVRNVVAAGNPKCYARRGGSTAYAPSHRLRQVPPHRHRTTLNKGRALSRRLSPGDHAVSGRRRDHRKEQGDHVDVRIPSNPPELTIEAARALLSLLQNVARRRPGTRSCEPEMPSSPARRAA
jgi:hypothetical protein